VVVWRQWRRQAMYADHALVSRKPWVVVLDRYWSSYLPQLSTVFPLSTQKKATDEPTVSLAPFLPSIRFTNGCRGRCRLSGWRRGVVSSLCKIVFSSRSISQFSRMDPKTQPDNKWVPGGWRRGVASSLANVLQQ
jgi:hypothetical protein